MSSICIVDDNPTALAHFRGVLQRAGMEGVSTYQDPRLALEEFKLRPPGVLLLDYEMPYLNGVSFLEEMHRAGIAEHVPVAIISGGNDLDALKMAAYHAGAVDVWSKSAPSQELVLKVRNLKRLAALAPVPSGRRTVDATLMRMLERVAAIRDEDTGMHTSRMAQYAAVIARACGLSTAQQAQLLAAAPLHDIGKVGVPDTVLHNPGRLSPAEIVQMRCHTTIGYELLRDEESPLLQLAAEVALSHHEKWDGSGYPLGLSGEEIPFSGRIVAVADVFDALTTVRSYKPAWMVERAVEVIEADAGAHFDPAVVDAFKRALPDILRIKQHFDGEEAFVPRAALPQ